MKLLLLSIPVFMVFISAQVLATPPVRPDFTGNYYCDDILLEYRDANNLTQSDFLALAEEVRGEMEKGDDTYCCRYYIGPDKGLCENLMVEYLESQRRSEARAPLLNILQGVDYYGYLSIIIIFPLLSAFLIRRRLNRDNMQRTIGLLGWLLAIIVTFPWIISIIVSIIYQT